MLAALVLAILQPPRFVTAATKSGSARIMVYELVGGKARLLAEKTMPWHNGGETLAASHGPSYTVLPRGPDLTTLRLNRDGSKLAYIHSGPATHRKYEPGVPGPTDWPTSGPGRAVIVEAATFKTVKEIKTVAVDVEWTNQSLQYFIPNAKNPSLLHRSSDPFKYPSKSGGKKPTKPRREIPDSWANSIMSKSGLTLCNGSEKKCGHRRTNTLLESGFLRLTPRQMAIYGFDKSGEHKVWLLTENAKLALKTQGMSVKAIQPFGDRIVVISYLSNSRNGIVEIFDHDGRKVTEAPGSYFSAPG